MKLYRVFGLVILSSISLLLLFGTCLTPLNSTRSNQIIQPRSAADLPIVVNSDADWTSIPNISGAGTQGDPYIIKDKVIDAAGVDSGIWIGNTTAYFVIQNCSVRGSAAAPHAGIRLSNVTNGQLVGNNCSENAGAGIYIGEVDLTQFENNTINGNAQGIYWEQGDNNTILRNNITGNTAEAIFFNPGGHNSTIQWNNISNNGYGIRWVSPGANACNNTVAFNFFGGNTNEGVRTEVGGDSNLFYGNNFSTAPNANDYGYWNRWDNGSKGNYWSTYTGVDANDDFIGDTPYVLGGSGAQDNFPIWDDGDNVAPAITITGLVTNQVYGASAPSYGLTIVEAYAVDATWVSYDNGVTNFTCGISGTLPSWGTVSNGTVTVTFYANDTGSNVGTASIIVQKDSIAPSITGTGLIAYTVYGSTAPTFSLTISEANLDEIWYSLDGGATKTTCTLTGDLSAQWSSYGNGTVTVTFYANDTMGNEGSTSVTLRKDIIAPTFTGTGLVAYTVYGSTAPSFNLAITEANLQSTWYSLDNYVTNTTCALIDTLATQWGARPNGTVTVLFWASDTMGNIGSTSVVVRKDIIAPSITGTGLTAYTIYGSTAPTFSLTITEANLAEIWYSLDGGATMTPCTQSGNLDAQWGSQPNGTVTVTFYANDTMDNQGSTSVVIRKDIIAPIFTGTGLTAYTVYGATAPTFILTISEANLAEIWYSLDGGATMTPCTQSGNLDAQWGSQPNGTVTVTFFANDTMDNQGSTSVVLRKDVIAPSITGTGLTPYTVYGATAPTFSLTITEANLAEIWYSLDGGATMTPCTQTGNLGMQWGSQPNGTVTVIFYANDTMDNQGSTSVVIRKDTIAPSITGTGLVAYTVYGTTPPTFSLTITEANLAEIWYSLDGGATMTPCTQSGNLGVQWGSQPNGTVTVTFYANDTMDNQGSTSVTLRKDVIAPSITGTGLTPFTVYGATAPTFSLTITEANLAEIWYSLDGGATMTPCTQSGNLGVQWGSQPNGTVTVMFFANDTMDNQGSTSVTLRKDVIAPSITGTGLVAYTVYGTTAPTFSLTITEGNLAEIWYSLDGGATMTPCTQSGNLGTQWGSQPNGTVTVMFFANDTMDNQGSTSVVLRKDTIAPSITGTGLTPFTVYGTTAPTFSLTITEANLAEIWYSLDGGATMTPCTLSGNLGVQWGSQPNGTVTVTFFANDSMDNQGSTSVVLRKDVIAPIFTGTGLTAYTVYGATAPTFTLTISEANLAEIWYSLDGGATMTPCTQSGNLGVQWGSQPNGTVTVMFFANDTMDNQGSTSVVLRKDIIAPSITGTGLTPYMVYGETAPTFSLTITEANLAEIWYSLDGGATMTPCTQSGNLGAQWGPMPNGTVTVTFYANDTMDNQGSTSVIVRKDVLALIITINSPTNGQIFNATAPSFDLTIDALDLDEIWYSLDNGVTNSSCVLFGDLSTQWSVQGNGTVTVTFWANDTTGNVGSAILLIEKDIQKPIITIVTPSNGTLYTDAPSWSLTISEGNLAMTWYTVSSSPVQYIFTGTSGTIDASAWGALPVGDVIIHFYANDSVGNENSTELLVKKAESGGITPPPPGGDWMLPAIILGVVAAGVITVVVLVSRRRTPGDLESAASSIQERAKKVKEAREKLREMHGEED